MKREAVRQLQFLRPGALPPFTSDEDDDGLKPVDEYLAFYDEQDSDVVRAAGERYIQALESFRHLANPDAILDEVLQSQRAFLRVVPFVCDDLPDDLTLSDRKCIANLFRELLADGSYTALLRAFQQHILTLVERPQSCNGRQTQPESLR